IALLSIISTSVSFRNFSANSVKLIPDNDKVVKFNPIGPSISTPIILHNNEKKGQNYNQEKMIKINLNKNAQNFRDKSNNICYFNSKLCESTSSSKFSDSFFLSTDDNDKSSSFSLSSLFLSLFFVKIPTIMRNTLNGSQMNESVFVIPNSRASSTVENHNSHVSRVHVLLHVSRYS
ncbi:unnamed protein product, partial [Onchocerca flexuosa]|uniref:Uncharacterized protein n=1 Tax=Onchocerca flexuosa TaxID=387005 RepID=A0A183I4J8_9BILA